MNGASYTYYYDHQMRRRYKGYPTAGVSDEYFYSPRSELLVDQGNDSVSSPTVHPDDEYVWLDGRPVAMVRGQLSTANVRQADSTGACTRNGDGFNCGFYWIVTDPLGKPILMLDSARNIAGVGEYDPYGQVNRVATDGETTHNYCCGTSCPATASTAEKNCNPSSPGGTRVDFGDLNVGGVGGMTTDYRAKFQVIDLRSGGSCLCTLPGEGISDSVGLAEFNNDTQVITPSILGNHIGTNWTAWATPASGAARAQLYYGYYTSTIGRFNLCGSPCVATAGPAFTRTGAVMESYEYRRHQSATPFWTPLRFPGQYHDEETDLNQNWNRFYWPMGGRYLEPEPILQDTQNTIDHVRAGGLAPTYSYAEDNPVFNRDLSGRDIWTFDDGFHASVAFELSCGANSCTDGKNEKVLVIDYWCADQSDANCTFKVSKGASSKHVFSLSDLPVDPDARAQYCAADCETTYRALQAAEDSCRQGYNAITHSCRDVVDTALRVAGCPTLPFPSKLRRRR